MAHRLVGYTMRLAGSIMFPDTYFTVSGYYTHHKFVLSKEQVTKVWTEYANSGAFFQLPIVTPVYDYRRRC